MTWFKCVGGSGGGGTTSKTIYLTENLKIAYDASTVKSNPYNESNYITVSDNVVTLKRSTSYGLWLTIPIELEAGKLYAFSYDSVTNSDGKVYLDRAPNGIPTTGDVTITRVENINIESKYRGVVFKVSTTGYYGAQFWSGNTNDIVATNPSITEIS